MAVRVRWPDGSEDQSETFGQLLKSLLSWQWRRMSMPQFKRELANRAAVWSATHIETEATGQEFFRELERAGMLEIIEPIPE